jgi:nitrite reductase (NO-forming)
MRKLHAILPFAVAAMMLVACGTPGTSKTWTFPPRSSESVHQPATSAPVAVTSPTPASSSPIETVVPSATPGATSTPTTPPGDGDVIPLLTAKAELQPAPDDEVNVSYAPDVPAASNRTAQAIVDVWFDVVEGVKAIDPNGTEYTTWGYRLHGDSEVTSGTPGPLIRARVGDVLRFTITNLPGNSMPHNVDFHAVTGQGGGAANTTVNPGETTTIEARLLYPGIFMYHCAAGDVPQHIVQGMYGGILVDPETPLPAVEHELYMVQSEYYTSENGTGPLVTDRNAVTDEHPTYVVFNGAVGSLTGDNAPKMNVGERMRIYFVNAGLNLDSNFHPIGSHWDKVWQEGALLNDPLRGSQTTLVAAGGGTVVEIFAQVPHTIVLVDHALARAVDKGAIGQVIVEGEPNTEIFEAFPIETAAPGEPTPTPAGSPTTSPEPTATPGAGTGNEVSIVAGAFNFQPLDSPDEFAATEAIPDYSVNDLMIPVGTTVTWTNNDPGMIHTVTAVDGTFDSGNIAEGGTFSYTFDTPGTFEYFCTPHPWMRARVTVMMH